MSERVNIIIADDHVSVRDGLRYMLSGDPRYVVIAAVSSGEDLRQSVEQHRPDLVITDIKMPDGDGLAVGRELKVHYPDLLLVAYTGFDKNNLLLEIIKAGFDGIIFKRAERAELLQAFTTVLDGYMGFCNAARKKVNTLIQMKHYNPREHTVKPILNDRYMVILKHIANGMTSEEIAKEMNLGIQTIHTYRKRLLIKTGCRNPANLVQYAFANGLFDDNE